MSTAPADHAAAIVYRPLDPALGSAADLAVLRALRAERRAAAEIAPPAPAPHAAAGPRRLAVATRPTRGRHRAARGLLGLPHPA